jgi:hypothetical protein
MDDWLNLSFNFLRYRNMYIIDTLNECIHRCSNSLRVLRSMYINTCYHEGCLHVCVHIYFTYRILHTCYAFECVNLCLMAAYRSYYEEYLQLH